MIKTTPFDFTFTMAIFIGDDTIEQDIVVCGDYCIEDWDGATINDWIDFGWRTMEVVFPEKLLKELEEAIKRKVKEGITEGKL